MRTLITLVLVSKPCVLDVLCLCCPQESLKWTCFCGVTVKAMYLISLSVKYLHFNVLPFNKVSFKQLFKGDMGSSVTACLFIRLMLE